MISDIKQIGMEYLLINYILTVRNPFLTYHYSPADLMKKWIPVPPKLFLEFITQSLMLNENKVFLIFKIFKENVPQRVLFSWKDCSMCNQILQAASISDKKF